MTQRGNTALPEPLKQAMALVAEFRGAGKGWKQIRRLLAAQGFPADIREQAVASVRSDHKEPLSAASNTMVSNRPTVQRSPAPDGLMDVAWHGIALLAAQLRHRWRDPESLELFGYWKALRKPSLLAGDYDGARNHHQSGGRAFFYLDTRVVNDFWFNAGLNHEQVAADSVARGVFLADSGHFTKVVSVQAIKKRMYVMEDTYVMTRRWETLPSQLRKNPKHIGRKVKQ